MPKPKNAFPSERFRLDGFIEMESEGVTKHEREQKFYDWYMLHKQNRQAATLAKGMITAILNGEMGSQFVEAVERGNTEEAVDALFDLLSVTAQ